MQYLILNLLLTCAVCERKLLKDIQFGATSSAYQYEGAWNEDGKGPSIWDVAVRDPSRIRDGSNGDITTDTYHRYKDDVQLMSNLGLDFFRFSFSWPRILPTGFPNNINQAGLNYYNNFIDELIKHNITPCATIYHWDLPQNLQVLGGWTNPNIVQWFEDYANIVFDNFSDRIKMWTTINEPIIICSYGYALEYVAPFVKSPGTGEYMCVRNVLLSHAKAYRLYHEYYNEDKNGQVGIALNPEWTSPLTTSQDDQLASFYTFQFSFSIIANPIFSKSGDYPDAVKSRVAAKSFDQGFPRSRLERLTEKEIETVKGSADFLGINHYHTHVVYKNTSELKGTHPVPSMQDDIGADICKGERSFDPSHLYNILMTVKELYNPTVHITESGWHNHGGLVDDDRIDYLEGHIEATLAAAGQGCDVRGYSVWSLLDNFEWSFGYTKKFGLYEVDFSSPNLTRTPRKSAHFYKNIIQTRATQRYNNTKIQQ